MYILFILKNRKFSKNDRKFWKLTRKEQGQNNTKNISWLDLIIGALLWGRGIRLPQENRKKTLPSSFRVTTLVKTFLVLRVTWVHMFCITTLLSKRIMHVLGSRAVVMECQYGPRRKGNPHKKIENSSGDYKLTCPARLVQLMNRKFKTVMVNNFTIINKMNNHLSP